MTDILPLPFYSYDQKNIYYLEQYPCFDLAGLDMGSPGSERFLLAEGIQVARPDFQTGTNVGDQVMVLEPHPDDFALSSSGYVMSRLDAGDSCLVQNLFSRTAIERFPWHDKVDLTEEQLENLRLLESRVAVEEYLGQAFHSLRLPLASKRGYTEIFGNTHRDQALVERIGEKLVHKIIELEVETVLSPLAVQGHIDHLVTFDVGMHIKKALGDQIELLVYEDYPYSRNKSAYNSRIQATQKQYSMEAEYTGVDDYLGYMASMAIIYRSQFDDINRDQMYAVMREDLRATALEARAAGIILADECAQRYWRIDET